MEELKVANTQVTSRHKWPPDRQIDGQKEKYGLEPDICQYDFNWIMADRFVLKQELFTMPTKYQEQEYDNEVEIYQVQLHNEISNDGDG